MISEIREYLTNCVNAVDPDMKQNESAFYNFDIGESVIDYFYQVEIRAIVPVTREAHRQHQVTASISIFGIGGTNEVETFDDLMRKAVCIRDTAIDIQEINKYDNSIINVIDDGIQAQSLPSDDNSFKIDINLTLEQAYSLEE